MNTIKPPTRWSWLHVVVMLLGVAMVRNPICAEDLRCLSEDASTLLFDALMGDVSRQYEKRRQALKNDLAGPQTARKRQKRLLQAYRSLLGPFPERTPLRPEVT